MTARDDLRALIDQPQQTIRQLRQARGWSQLELALEVGVDQSTVAKWERGRMPTPSHRLALADLFGVPVEAIAFGPAEQVPQDRP